MQRAHMEDVVQLALQEGLIGPEKRRILLNGLPMGFVYSLPTVSRPIDQLRFDLMELQRTPRLIGLDRSPLSVWLENAAVECATRGRAGPARTFAAAADAQREGSNAVTEQIARLLGASSTAESPRDASPAPTMQSASRPSPPTPVVPPSPSPARPQVVFALAPAVKNQWRDVVPAIDLAEQHVADIPEGDWYDDELPHGRHWVAARRELKASVQRLPADGALAVFSHGPVALAALVGVRLAQRGEWTVHERTREEGQSMVRPFGPHWPQPVRPEQDAPVTLQTGDIADAADVALVVQLDRRARPRALAMALQTAGCPEQAKVTVALANRRRTVIARPERVEAIVERIEDAFHVIGGSRAERLHLFYHGPNAILMRSIRERPGIETIVYEYQSSGRYVPALHLGGPRHEQLVRPVHRPAGTGDRYDVFIAYSGTDRPFALDLHAALTRRGKRAFLDARSVRPGKNWDVEIPAGQAQAAATCVLISDEIFKAWYLRDEIIHAIRKARTDEQSHHIIPVLLDRFDQDEVPYGLGRVQSIAGDRQSPTDTADAIIHALDELTARPADEAADPPPTP